LLDVFRNFRLVNRLSVERLKDGEALSDFDPRELNYYSEYKLRGKSYVQHLADELKAGGIIPPGPASGV
jgi:hypothetical protein